MFFCTEAQKKVRMALSGLKPSPAVENQGHSKGPALYTCSEQLLLRKSESDKAGLSMDVVREMEGNDSIPSTEKRLSERSLSQ